MRVVHCKREPYTRYIGRPSVLGNPFIIGKHGTREQVIEMYRQWALTQPHVMSAIMALADDDVLGCWCHPQPCHGQVIIELRAQRREGP